MTENVGLIAELEGIDTIVTMPETIFMVAYRMRDDVPELAAHFVQDDDDGPISLGPVPRSLAASGQRQGERARLDRLSARSDRSRRPRRCRGKAVLNSGHVPDSKF